MPPVASRTVPRGIVAIALFLVVPSASAQDVKAVLESLNTPATVAKVREILAADAVGVRARVDSFALSGNAITVAGVLLVPGAADEDFAAVEKELRAKVVAAAQQIAGAKDFQEFDLTGMKAVRGEKLPHLQLQYAANAAGATDPAVDQLMLTDATFDAKGRLVLTGRRGTSSRTIEWLNANTAKVLAQNSAVLGPDGKPTPVVFDLREPEKGFAWPLVPAELQKSFAKQPGLARLRVDRAYLAASPAKLGESNPSGMNWTYVLAGVAIGTQPVPKAELDRITKQIVPQAFAAAKWPAIKSGDLEQLTVADVRMPDPAAKLQAAIALQPALDGVRLDARTEFDSEGKLALAGLQPGLDAKGAELLTAKVRDVLAALALAQDGNARYQKLTDRGVSLAKLDRIKVRELHADLKRFAAEQLDETRLARLFYDEAGKLTLTCDTPELAHRTTVAAELKTRAEKLGVPGEPVVTASAAPLARSITAHLQERITDPKTPKWDAVLVERGYFDERNRFVLRGVVNSEHQKRELAELLAVLAQEKEWAGYFAAAPAAEPDVAVIPVEKLVERAARVMPGHTQFDGIRITGARYAFEKDAKGIPGQTLVFVAHLAGRPDAKVPAALQAMIAEDAKGFARRLPKGRMLRIEQDPRQAAANKELNDFSIGYGAEALAKNELDKANGWLEIGRLHYPADSTVWYLSAYYHHLRGDEELTRRDLYRTIEVENRLDFNGRVARNRRYEAAKALQGEKRDELEKLWLKCWKEVKDGTQLPLKFAKEK